MGIMDDDRVIAQARGKLQRLLIGIAITWGVWNIGGCLPNPSSGIDAGQDQTLTWPNNVASLAGAVPGNSPATVTWSKLSGPGEVAFDNAGSLVTTARFSLPGRYLLRLFVADPAVGIGDTVEITIRVRPRYDLTVGIEGEGRVDPNGGVYNAGAEVMLAAEPANGWHFVRWEGGLTGPNNPAALTVEDDTTVRAVFEPNQYDLTVNIQGQGTVDPSGGVHEALTTVALAATAADQWHFVRWEGDLTGPHNTANLLMDTPKTVTAVFEPNVYALTVVLRGQGSIDPNGGEYNGGTPVTLTATPAEDWHFVRWEGDLNGSDNPVTLSMNGGKAVRAVFEADPKPDLALASVTINGIEHHNGDTLTIRKGTVLQIVQHVLNQGTAASSECRFLVARGISSADVSAPLLQTQVPGLDPNETWDVADLSASIWNDVGTHYLNCRIDSANEVRESDEGNNTTSIKIVCVAPDLVIPPLTINGVECLDGDVLTVSKGTVLNIGQRVRNIGTSASSECRLYTAWGASPTDFSHFLVAARISGLNPAATSELVALTSYTWDQTGTYYLNSRVDDLSEVDESDEGNNTISVTIVAE